MYENEDDVKERQEFEVEAIKAIYLSDVIDLRASPDELPKFSIRLLPQRGSSGGGQQRQFSVTSILLTIKISSDYPNVIPDLSISECKGLSSQEVNELKLKLEKLAAASVGEVMVLNLAQFAEGYLYKHQKTPTGSFYDEMLLRQKLIQEQSDQKKLENMEKERIANQEAIQRKQDELKEQYEALRRRKEELKAQNEVNNVSPPSSYQSSPVKGDGFPLGAIGIGVTKHKKRRSISLRRRRSTSEGSDSSMSEYSDMITLDFSCQKITRKFQRGELLGESVKGSKVYAGMDCTSGGLVAISEWTFSLGKKDKKGRLIKEIGGGDVLSYEAVMKQLNAFESEFNLLQKLEQKNIVLYLGFKVVCDSDPSIVTLYLANEFIRGTALKSYLQDMLTLDVALVRHCAIGILQALDYLHANNVVHRFLRDTSVFMDTSGEVKVGDYGLERKICELYQSTCGNTDVIVVKFPPSIGRGAKKGDIYRFGILILSLLKGQQVVENPPDIPSSLPLEIQDFLKRCLTTNEHSRATASQLLEHTFIKTPLQKNAFLRADAPLIDEKENVSAEADEVRSFNLPLCKGISRLQNEFEVLLWLGKGGFGDVLKVKNKLDGGIYAIKRIRLDPKKKQLNKKITREVKLLSQLNHENVVRYYNSWIETVVDCVSDESSLTQTLSTAGTGTRPTNPKSALSVRFKLDNEHQNSLGFDDNVEALAPSIGDTASQWSISIRDANDGDGYDSDESSEEDIFGTSFLRLANEESDSVVFESGSPSTQNDSTTDISKDKSNELTEANASHENNGQTNDCIMAEFQYMYIQMEFCEKSTLRTAIDNGLYQDGDRVWRLFREIVEGLSHIHQQGMIHRDLKPVNIFLDSNDHVKIGDFGLATTNILNKATGGDITISEFGKVDVHRSIDFTEESMTGHVGTALYVAPELVITTGTKALYNQKVDIYSLGIILFEMFYQPLDTGMERVRVIAALRQKDITFPDDFEDQLPQVAHIARWILNHDPSKRPTSVELLQSDYMPPPVLEEAELHDMFRHTLSNPQSKVYKYLVASCMQQNVSTTQDLTYNYGMGRLKPSASDQAEQFKSFTVIQKVKRIIQVVFERHGAIEFDTPFLTPKSAMYDHHKASVHLMSHNGSIVTMPFDLRVPFARHVVWNNINHMKRYSVGKVFRENRVYGYHPTELYECAMDVIAPSKESLIIDAEILSVVLEIINDIPWLRDRSFTIRLSHTLLLDAVLLHHGIDEKYHHDIKVILAGIKPEKNSKSQVQTHLVSLCLPDQFISTLFTLMEIEGPLAKVSNIFKGILKKQGAPSSKVKEGLHELEVLIGHLDAFGLKCDIVVTPSVVFGTNVYSGLLFQVVCNLKKRKNLQTVDVIAVGGRYDGLLNKFRSTLEMYGQSSKDVTQSGVGISISLDKLVAGLEVEERDKIGASRTVDVLICSLGHHPMCREKIGIMKDFLAHGIQCALLDEPQTLESAEDQCRKLGASFIVFLKETDDIRIRIWDKDRFQDRQSTKSDAVDFILRNKRATFERSDSSNVAKGEGPNSRIGGQSIDSNSTTVSAPTSGSGGMPAVNISFVIHGTEKLAIWKRRYENQMMSHIADILPKFSRQQIIELVGLDVNNTVIKSLASYLQLQDREEYNKSVSEVIEKHPKQKKYLKSICDEIYELSFEKREKSASVLIIYGIVDNSYRVLI